MFGPDKFGLLKLSKSDCFVALPSMVGQLFPLPNNECIDLYIDRENGGA